eukprot:SAG11_NODE_1567_length_4672_cov_13.208834_5_plen_109_part_00
MLGAPAGELRGIGVALLAGKSAQGGSERNWNVYEKIQSDERNLLGIEKIDKLVSIYSNERLAKTVTALDYSEDKLELTLETRAMALGARGAGCRTLRREQLRGADAVL